MDGHVGLWESYTSNKKNNVRSNKFLDMDEIDVVIENKSPQSLNI